MASIRIKTKNKFVFFEKCIQGEKYSIYEMIEKYLDDIYKIFYSTYDKSKHIANAYLEYGGTGIDARTEIICKEDININLEFQIVNRSSDNNSILYDTKI